MPTWKELEADFRELQGKLSYSRLDAQWGSSGEYWRLAGPQDPNARRRFEALSLIAGEKLGKALYSSSEKSAEDVLDESDPMRKWYRGIWKISQNFEYGPVGQELDDDDKVVGHIFTGSIQRPAEASSVFCLELAARFPENDDQPQAIVSAKQTSHKSFWEDYGRPIIIGLLVTVLGSLLIAAINLLL